MSQREFANAALVLLGHGTTSDPNSSAPVYQHAAELRRRGCFDAVQEAFWKQTPHVADVLSALHHAVVFIAPLFISEGYFTEQVIPQALGFVPEISDCTSRVQRRSSATLVYCRPLGTHPAMTQVLKARAAEVLERFPFPRPPQSQEISLFIAGHGTEQTAHSRQAVDRQVELLRAEARYGAVQAVFLDEEPRIPRCYEMAPTRNLVVVPFFMSDGLHARQDIPVLSGEPEQRVQQRLQQGQPPWRNPTEKHGKLVWYARSVGTEPLLAEAILACVREGAAWLE